MSTGCAPENVGTGVNIRWTIPADVAARTDINYIHIHRSSAENSAYTKIATVAYGTAPNAVTTYYDPEGVRSMFYLVTFVSTTTPYESCFHLTFCDPLPSEARLIEQIRRATPAIIQDTMTNEDYMNGLTLGLGIFNCYPPQTSFTLANFPKECEFFLIGLGQLTALTSRFLPLSIRDWRYSEPGGVVMDVDRGQKVNQALEIIARTYTQYLPLVKLDFADDFPMGVGTIQLPLSMGGIVSRGILNILDIFTATGR